MKLIRQTALLALLAAAGSSSCATSRPSRNGVPNENHYIHKSFLVRDGTSDTPDPGWMMKVTVVSTSTPNPLGTDFFSISPGIDNNGSLVRFRVTEDHVQLLNLREVTGVPSDQRTEQVANAWPAQNVDIQYQVNLDGETTNWLQENTERDWQTRQWVKIAFNKHDSSDFAPLGAYVNESVMHCIDSANTSATLVPDSFYVDEDNGYMQWVLSVTVPLRWDVDECVQAYGVLGREAADVGKESVTVNLMYSFMRANPAPTYTPLVVDEKDPIRHKYGFFETHTEVRDETTGQLATRGLVNRFDPNQDTITWYFARGFPEEYKSFFTGPGGIADQTNDIFARANAHARLVFKNFDQDLGDGKCPIPGTDHNHQCPREYGDVRYNFLVWVSDRDTQDFFAGVTPSVVDPRTGETISSSITLSDFAIHDLYTQRIDSYLTSIGASDGVNTPEMWTDPGPCQDGDTMPLVPETARRVHDGMSSLYQKMQQYLQRPVDQYGPLGPQDFVVDQTQDSGDFYRAYFALLPYEVYADPATNFFVTPEGGGGVFGPGEMWRRLGQESQFQQLAARIDRGETPYEATEGTQGVLNANAFLNNFRQLTLGHKDYRYALRLVNHGMHLDSPTAFSFEEVMARDARHCIDGHWETRDEWVHNLVNTYWSQVAWHEFGHALGLTHNFMASVDMNNFPHFQDRSTQHRDHVGLYASSVMEYNAAPDRIFWHPGWGPYDQGAIGWLYGNSQTPASAGPHGDRSTSISGQASSTAPWNDPYGFNADGTERQFLFCNEYHLAYTPLCRQGDMGVTPSQIVANEIERYEWQYAWRNFRGYRPFWDDSAYANAPAEIITEMRRFMSQWQFDWSTGELADSFRRIGVNNPDPNGSDLEYYTQLTNKFNAEMSAANQLVAAFHEAIIQQSSGERPYRTLYDPYYGDVTQQGIILDKLFAMEGWVGLWPAVNYDPNQAGSYIASYAGIGDPSFNYVAQSALSSMVGGQYDVFPYFVPLAVGLFAQDSHDPSFFGQREVRDWIGGHVFYRAQDFLDYFRDLAVQANVPGCTTIETCPYDPRSVSDMHNEFLGPDDRRWIWAYIQDRNQWVAVQRDRNTASYVIVRNYTDDVIYQMDDGAYPGAAYDAQLPMKFFLDSFNLYN